MPVQAMQQLGLVDSPSVMPTRRRRRRQLALSLQHRCHRQRLLVLRRPLLVAVRPTRRESYRKSQYRPWRFDKCQFASLVAPDDCHDTLVSVDGLDATFAYKINTTPDRLILGHSRGCVDGTLTTGVLSTGLALIAWSVPTHTCTSGTVNAGSLDIAVGKVGIETKSKTFDVMHHAGKPSDNWITHSFEQFHRCQTSFNEGSAPLLASRTAGRTPDGRAHQAGGFVYASLSKWTTYNSMWGHASHQQIEEWCLMGVMWVDSTARSEKYMDGELNTSSGKNASETTSCTSLGMSKHSEGSTYRCIGRFGSVIVAIPTTAQIIGRVSDTY